MALEAMKLAVRHGSGPKLPVDLLFMPDEEIGSVSSRALIETYGRNARYALVVEPARDGGKIVVARKVSPCTTSLCAAAPSMRAASRRMAEARFVPPHGWCSNSKH